MSEPIALGPRRPKRPLLRTTLGGVLRRVRLEQGRTLADVAKTARVSMPYLSELERGRKEASSEILAAICAALRLDLADLIDLVGRELAGSEPAAATDAAVVRLDRIGRLERQDGASRATRDLGAPFAPPGSGGTNPVCLLAA
jgi:transcriptional regulator with XRE-family HTH domain